MTEQVFRRVEDVIEREVAGEVFLVPIRGRLANLQELFVLNEVGGWLWERFDGSRSLADLVSGVVEEFDTEESEAREDATAFVRDLLDAGLVEDVVSGEDPAE